MSSINSPIGKTNWVIVNTGQGYACPHGVRDDLSTHSPENSVGVVQEELGHEIKVFLPGCDLEFIVKRTDTQGCRCDGNWERIQLHDLQHLLCNEA